MDIRKNTGRTVDMDAEVFFMAVTICPLLISLYRMPVLLLYGLFVLPGGLRQDPTTNPQPQFIAPRGTQSRKMSSKPTPDQSTSTEGLVESIGWYLGWGVLEYGPLQPTARQHDTRGLSTPGAGNNIGRVGTITQRERHPGSFEIIHIKDPAWKFQGVLHEFKVHKSSVLKVCLLGIVIMVLRSYHTLGVVATLGVAPKGGWVLRG